MFGLPPDAPEVGKGMLHLLSAQGDFKSTRSGLQEIVEDTGRILILYPDFHCELRCFARNYSLLDKQRELCGPHVTTCYSADCTYIAGFGIAESCSSAVKGSRICRAHTAYSQVL